MDRVIDRLASSEEPVIQYKLQVDVLGEDPDSEKMQKLQKKIRSSKLSRQLLSEKRADGRIPYHPYRKWYGPHWVLTDLADLHYPENDRSLNTLREQEYQWLFSKTHLETASFSRSHKGHVFSRDRPRIHASMEANAIFSLLRLGLEDDRTDELVDRLLKTQWPDGGWNCDRRPPPPHVVNSSFHETITPLRALAIHAKGRRSTRSSLAAKKAAEIFLKRKMFKRQSDSRVMDESFVKIALPSVLAL